MYIEAKNLRPCLFIQCPKLYLLPKNSIPRELETKGWWKLIKI